MEFKTCEEKVLHDLAAAEQRVAELEEKLDTQKKGIDVTNLLLEFLAEAGSYNPKTGLFICKAIKFDLTNKQEAAMGEIFKTVFANKEQEAVTDVDSDSGAAE